MLKVHPQVSITFDPFMYLTLPLPVTQKYKTTVYFIPYDPLKSPLQVCMRSSKYASAARLILAAYRSR
jgi:ubiquitin carboxyl-terminal hydrolase 4/11/15